MNERERFDKIVQRRQPAREVVGAFLAL